MTAAERNFYDKCAEFNISLQKKTSEEAEKEVVPEETAYKSLIIARNYNVSGIGDLLLFSAALNVLNTYVKQSRENKKKVGYAFKSSTDIVVRYLLNNPTELARFEFQKDHNMPFLILEIGTIQFSFHNIVLPHDCAKSCHLLEPEKCTLAWDGIKKQSCAVSVFEFAEKNSFGRTDKMLNGADYQSELNKLLTEYHDGKKTISDVKYCLYSDNLPSGKKWNRIRKNGNDSPYVQLYSGSVSNFIKSVEDREFIKIITKKYESELEQQLPERMKNEWKYEFETLLNILFRTNAKQDTGIAVNLIRTLGYECISVTLLSKDGNGTINYCIVVLLPWAGIRKSFKTGKIEFSDQDSDKFAEAINPWAAVADTIRNISTALSAAPVELGKGCLFLFDSDKKSTSDLSFSDDYPDVRIFYASERKELCDYIANVAAMGNGYKSVEAFSKYIKSALAQKRFVSEKIVNKNDLKAFIKNMLNIGKPFLMTVAVRVMQRKKEILEQFEKVLTESGIRSSVLKQGDDKKIEDDTEAVIYFDWIPAKIDFSSALYHFVLIDEIVFNEEKKKNYQSLKSAALERNIICPVYLPTDDNWFSDGGNGISFLIRLLSFVTTAFVKWDPGLYSIDVVEDFLTPKTDGIADVVIGKNFVYDLKLKTVSADIEDKRKLYEQLCEGRRGLRLRIEDNKLKEYVSNKIYISKMTVLQIKASSGEYDEQIKALKKLSELCEINSPESRFYTTKAIDALGYGCWKKLSKESQNFVVSALLSFYDMKSSDEMMDYSGVALMISKVYEVELCRRLSVDYFNYLKDRFGEEDLIKNVPAGFTYVRKDTAEVRLANPSTITMGSFCYLMGLNPIGKIYNIEEYDKFVEFASENLLVSTEEIPSQLAEICLIADHVRTEYRNTSSHKEPISVYQAEDCLNYCILQKRTLGVIMDKFKY